METIVDCNGALYLMTFSRFMEMMQDYADGKSILLTDYGRKVERFDFSTIRPAEAKAYLEMRRAIAS